MTEKLSVIMGWELNLPYWNDRQKEHLKNWIQRIDILEIDNKRLEETLEGMEETIQENFNQDEEKKEQIVKLESENIALKDQNSRFLIRFKEIKTRTERAEAEVKTLREQNTQCYIKCESCKRTDSPEVQNYLDRVT